MPSNEREGILVEDPTTLQERQEVAGSCALILDIKIPMLVDGVDDTVGQDYAGWPDRLYIVDTEGAIAYKGGPGPMGFQPLEMEEALVELLGGEVTPGDV